MNVRVRHQHVSIIWAAAVSLVLHGLVAVLMIKIGDAETIVRSSTAKKVVPVKISLKSSQPREVAIAHPRRLSKSSGSKPAPPVSLTPPPKSLAGNVASAPSVNKSHARFGDLLPTPGMDPTMFKQGIRRNVAGGTAASVPFYDEESALYSPETKAFLAPDILVIARIVRERINIPSALLGYVSAASARARVRGSGSQWDVSLADGDPYFRSLLYDGLLASLPDSLVVKSLHHSNLESVRFELQFAKMRTSKPILEPLVWATNIDANKILYSVTLWEPDVNVSPWVVTDKDEATGTARAGFNLLAPLFFAAQHLSHDCFECDPDIKKLRSSPAFLRAFVK